MVLHMIVRGARVLDASARAAEACDILISDGAIAAMLADVDFYHAIPGLFDALPAKLQEALLKSEVAGADVVLGSMKKALHEWSHDRDRVRLGLAPTIPLHCSEALIVGSARLASEYETVVQSHVAESKTQAVSALRRWGKSLTAHIDDLGLLGPNFTVAHGVWLDDNDMRRLADHGAFVA